MVQRKKTFGIDTPLELIDDNSDTLSEVIDVNNNLINQVTTHTEELKIASDSLNALEESLDKTRKSLKSKVNGTQKTVKRIEDNINSFDPLTQNIEFGLLGEQDAGRGHRDNVIPFVDFNGIIRSRQDRHTVMSTDTNMNLTVTLGGGSQYFMNGGSRNFLGYVGGNPDDTELAQNANFDLKQNISLSGTIEGQTLFPGTIFALYLVSVNRNPSTMYIANGQQYLASSIEDALTSEPDYNDSWGVGYQDAQGEGTGICIELDIIEMSCNNVATTTHGISNNDVTVPTYDKSGSWASAWGGYGYIDPSNPGEDIEFTSAALDSLSSANPPLGPGPAFKIDTTKPIDFKCEINAPTIKSTDNIAPGGEGQLSMVTIISQGSESITLEPQYVDGFFTDDPNLSNMQLVCSLWTTDYEDPSNPKAPVNSSWWLDGFQQGYNSDGSLDLNDYSVRSFSGFVDPADQYLNKLTDPTVVSTLKFPECQYYDSLALPLSQALVASDVDKVTELGPVMGRITNLNISVPVMPSGIASSTQMCWILDGMYRGVSDDAKNWTGAYGNAYGIATNGTGDVGEYGPGTGGVYYDVDTSYIDPDSYQDNVMAKIQKAKSGNYFGEISGLGVTSGNQQDAQDEYPNFETNGLEGMSPYNYIPTDGHITDANSTRYGSQIGGPFILGLTTPKFIGRNQ